MFRHSALIVALATVLVFAVIAACGGDDDSSSRPTITGEGVDPSRTAPATITTAPTPGGDPLVPPLEGPDPGGLVTEQKDWREDPAWQMPDPADVPAADDPDDPVLNPPAEPTCPEDWILLNRPTEGFTICYPSSWVVAGHGFVSSANESRWYSLGIFDFSDPENQIQRAHASVYAFPQFSRPVRYILDCPEPLSVTLSGEPAVVCPDFPGADPEAEIISYHVFREGFDYFVNVATYYEYDPEAQDYTDDINKDSRAVGIQIAHTFTFIPVARPAESESPTDSPAP